MGYFREPQTCEHCSLYTTRDRTSYKRHENRCSKNPKKTAKVSNNNANTQEPLSLPASTCATSTEWSPDCPRPANFEPSPGTNGVKIDTVTGGIKRKNRKALGVDVGLESETSEHASDSDADFIPDENSSLSAHMGLNSAILSHSPSPTMPFMSAVSSTPALPTVVSPQGLFFGDKDRFITANAALHDAKARRGVVKSPTSLRSRTTSSVNSIWYRIARLEEQVRQLAQLTDRVNFMEEWLGSK